MTGSPPARGRARRRLGQNFLRDPNLLKAIVRDSNVGAEDVVLEVGGGTGALTERLAPRVKRLHVVELDRRLEPELGAVAAAAGNVELHWGDAMRLDLAALDPAPVAMVANLPYAIATPLLLRTIEELSSLVSWTVLVQREIAERLAAAPGSRIYGSPSVLVQLACQVSIARRVGREVFEPPPRVDSAVLRLDRTGPAASEPLRALVRGAFAHRRKSLARSLDHAAPGERQRALVALEAAGLPARARAEVLSPADFERLGAALGEERKNQ
ncbi:MAG: 16S rRNA (adenine(1518)-N(6)/adenine(1519)-N(6))-dimethyltransferase RsmA [Solirubrobacterales bacterium]